jgi:hypothetical protein
MIDQEARCCAVPGRVRAWARKQGGMNRLFRVIVYRQDNGRIPARQWGELKTIRGWNSAGWGKGHRPSVLSDSGRERPASRRRMRGADAHAGGAAGGNQ